MKEIKIMSEEIRTKECELCGEESTGFVENLYYDYTDDSWNLQIVEACKKHIKYLNKSIRRRNRKNDYKMKITKLNDSDFAIIWKCIE